MKTATKLIITTAYSAAFTAGSFGVTISGTAIVDPKDFGGGDLAGGQASFVIFDTADDGFGVSSLINGDTIEVGKFFNGGNDFVLALNSTIASNPPLLPDPSIPGDATFTLGTNGIDANDPFGILFFDGISSSATVNVTTGDNYGFVTDASWVAPSNNSASPTFGGGGSLAQLNGLQANQTVAVPEPASYAMIFGLLGLGMALVRRRRRG